MGTGDGVGELEGGDDARGGVNKLAVALVLVGPARRALALRGGGEAALGVVPDRDDRGQKDLGTRP